MRRIICLLLALLFGCAAFPARCETLQDCHRVTVTKKDTTQDNGSVVRRWTLDTALDSVDAELDAIMDEMEQRIAPTLPKAQNKTNGNSRVDISCRYSRTGLSWMSFVVQARTTFHRGLVGQEVVTRTFNMLTGEQITMTDLFADDSEGWLLLEEAVEAQVTAVYPDEKPDPEALATLTSREGLEQIGFSLEAMSLVLHIPTASVYPAHEEKDATLIEVTLFYPDIRPYMTAEARLETDNQSYYKMVALTFDDGPTRTNTTAVLNSLLQCGAKGTFFVIGNLIGDLRDLVQRENDEGHSIGTHNWTHANANKVSAATLQGYKTKCDAAMLDAVGWVSRYDRVPYGLYPPMIKAKVGWPYIQWSMDTYDWRGRSTNVIMRHVKEQISDGDIILCHDIKDNTPATAIAICEYLAEEGYMLVTIDELFAKDGVELEPDTVYFRCVDGDTSEKR